ncbi:MAG: undecaprenyl-diphosphate phosphatase [Candidatus Omnitrophica bacterium]|nr:undecaprenyl-diphosphate phosphatase [Candidatus Omnitrophota bacterium]
MLKLIILGIVQGLTEFLPVSSSGHLVVLERLFGLSQEAIAITVILHLGTCLSLLVFFFKDILKLLRSLKLITLVIIVTAITGVIGLSGKDFFEALFSSPRAVAFGWLITAAILFAAQRFMDAKREDLNFKDASFLGLAQGLAIIPGVSRSGMTVSSLLFRKIDRNIAFRFSFLASIPAIFAAAILEARKIDFSLKLNPLELALGAVVSFLVGLLALRLLQQVLKKAKLYYFGYYCAIIAVLTLIFIK